MRGFARIASGDLASPREYVNLRGGESGTVRSGRDAGGARGNGIDVERGMARARGCIDTSLRRWFVIL